MAGGGGSDDMNPFISYVDLFASIIMVLLLFVLLLFVNVGYYMQFNTKDQVSDINTTEEKENAVVSSIDIVKKEDYKQKEIEKPVTVPEKKDINSTTKATDGNTISGKSETFASAEFKEQDMIVVFKNNEYFLNKDVILQISSFMEQIQKTRPSAIFHLSVGDSSKLISSTQTKQVSLGRILSLKNALQNIPSLKDKIKINYKQADTYSYEFGYLKIDAK
ncbi:hypothetical protein [Sulfurimonas sp.]|uniref:hypothetical protein n=1 Tax=Sulfurimonas sp. TaxID=2022749 RepID=UPI0025F70BF9|nr:hypothetical protein [Sulfurimonas sp.]MDD5158286.1 hypothetical protein [Sulfurimonas sp.]